MNLIYYKKEFRFKILNYINFSELIKKTVKIIKIYKYVNNIQIIKKVWIHKHLRIECKCKWFYVTFNENY